MLAVTYTTYGIQLQNGDLIFQEACPGETDDTIKQVTTSMDGYNFTHVGMIYIDENDEIFVLQATIPEVTLTPLEEYLYPTSNKACYPISVVGRIQERYQSLIPEALQEGMKLIGRKYNYAFDLSNDSYYCSELIYEIFRRANGGEAVFPLNEMTFKSLKTGEYTKGWIEWFDKLGIPVPEGEPGINPGAMSRSDILSFLIPF
ncbi:MAG: hypothetical protein LIP01_03340 [Tannerellaceae bacterium]|nr:hypothetical protein [Tannerellaceae bacterium]